MLWNVCPHVDYAIIWIENQGRVLYHYIVFETTNLFVGMIIYLWLHPTSTVLPSTHEHVDGWTTTLAKEPISTTQGWSLKGSSPKVQPRWLKRWDIQYIIEAIVALEKTLNIVSKAHAIANRGEKGWPALPAFRGRGEGDAAETMFPM